MNIGDIVFDVETKRSFDEVGGRDKLDKLGISVVGAYVYGENKYLAFEEHQIPEFAALLEKANVVIGFNIKYFDLAVLQPYVSWNLKNITALDLMDDVERGVGFRVSLDNLSSTTLGAQKSGDGLQALRWYKEGKIEEIKKYCLKDVELTKNLYEFGVKNGHVLFFSRDIAGKSSIPVSWGRAEIQNVRKVLQDAFQNRRTAKIEYLTKTASVADAPLRNVRLVDIHKLSDDSFLGYCHLRKEKRIFKIDRVLNAQQTDTGYKITEDVQFNLF